MILFIYFMCGWSWCNDPTTPRGSGSIPAAGKIFSRGVAFPSEGDDKLAIGVAASIWRFGTGISL